jgi:hypothetical protein
MHLDQFAQRIAQNNVSAVQRQLWPSFTMWFYPNAFAQELPSSRARNIPRLMMISTTAGLTAMNASPMRTRR